MGTLKKFGPEELVLSHMEAWEVLVFFFGGNAGVKPGWLNDNDRSFAQALLIEAIEASSAMSWIETLWKSSVKPNASVKGIIKALAKKAAKDWFKKATKGDLEDPEIYQSVKSSLTRNWRSAWEIRVQTDGETAVY